MKLQHLFEKTMQSRPPQDVEAIVKRLAYKHLYSGKKGQERYGMSDARHVMDFAEWQLARWEKDFDVQIKDTDPRRISIDIDGIVDLGIALDFVNNRDTKRDQINDAKQWLDKTMKPLGWFVFRVGGSWFQLDPISQEPIALPKKMYHFSPAWNKESILKRGLLPRRGHYEDDYIYPPRVHVLLKYDEGTIYNLALHVFNWGRSREDVYSRGTERTPLVVFEIDSSKLNKGTRFYHDISVDGGAWTYTHIPPSAIKIIHEDEVEKED